jgi:hypothetical protein
MIRRSVNKKQSVRSSRKRSVNKKRSVRRSRKRSVNKKQSVRRSRKRSVNKKQSVRRSRKRSVNKKRSVRRSRKRFDGVNLKNVAAGSLAFGALANSQKFPQTKISPSQDLMSIAESRYSGLETVPLSYLGSGIKPIGPKFLQTEISPSGDLMSIAESRYSGLETVPLSYLGTDTVEIDTNTPSKNIESSYLESVNKYLKNNVWDRSNTVESLSKILGVSSGDLSISPYSYVSQFPVINLNKPFDIIDEFKMDYGSIVDKLSGMRKARSQQIKTNPNLYIKFFPNQDLLSMNYLLSGLDRINKILPGNIMNYEPYILKIYDESNGIDLYALISEKVDGVVIGEYIGDIVDSIKEGDSDVEIYKKINKIKELMKKYNDISKELLDKADFVHRDMHFANVMVDKKGKLTLIDIEPHYMREINPYALKEFNTFKNEILFKRVYRPLAYKLRDREKKIDISMLYDFSGKNLYYSFLKNVMNGKSNFSDFNPDIHSIIDIQDIIEDYNWISKSPQALDLLQSMTIQVNQEDMDDFKNNIDKLNKLNIKNIRFSRCKIPDISKLNAETVTIQACYNYDNLASLEKMPKLKKIILDDNNNISSGYTWLYRGLDEYNKNIAEKLSILSLPGVEIKNLND